MSFNVLKEKMEFVYLLQVFKNATEHYTILLKF